MARLCVWRFLSSRLGDGGGDLGDLLVDELDDAVGRRVRPRGHQLGALAHQTTHLLLQRALLRQRRRRDGGLRQRVRKVRRLARRGGHAFASASFKIRLRPNAAVFFGVSLRRRLRVARRRRALLLKLPRALEQSLQPGLAVHGPRPGRWHLSVALSLEGFLCQLGLPRRKRARAPRPELVQRRALLLAWSLDRPRPGGAPGRAPGRLAALGGAARRDARGHERDRARRRRRPPPIDAIDAFDGVVAARLRLERRDALAELV
mmetsp:Transcript_4482/g.19109  ORF Transcript_4482/g.19109 Transcript_4482/m.19109 type:complete len:262 (-) Transcript_4482:1030-1815(-)